MTPAEGISDIGQMVWLEEVELGLTLWSGQFEEEVTRMWLRWCDWAKPTLRDCPKGSAKGDRDGQVILTGAERAETERRRAETERRRAETEQERAEMERQGREIERQRAERLAERLRAMGVNPDEI